MSILAAFISLVLYIIGYFLLFNAAYLLFFALAGHRKTRSRVVTPAATDYRRMCVLMPAYRADAVVLETAPLAQAHAYPGLHDVYVIADGLQPATLQSLRQQGVGIIQVAFDKSTKGKALLAAMQELPATAYDAVVVLDVDNLMDAGFLSRVSQAFVDGYRVVQGHRTAKNQDTPFAVLDACNEEINNHIFRQGHASIGLSAALIGSGMAFEYTYFSQILQSIGDTSGEDKQLDFCIVRDKIKVVYLPHAYVYDEKIQDSQAFTTQRTRWIAAQIEFLKKYFLEGPVQLWRGNIDFFDKVLQTLLVPRVLLMGLLGVLSLASLAGLSWGPGPLFWVGLLVCTASALMISLPARLYNRKVAQALVHLPVALGAMVVALLQVKKAKTSFMPTVHTTHRVKTA